MNFIHTTEWGFDTDLSMKKCIPEIKVLTEWELIDKIFDWDIFLEKLIGIDCNSSNPIKDIRKKVDAKVKYLSHQLQSMEKKISSTNYKSKEAKLKDIWLLLCMEEFMWD